MPYDHGFNCIIQACCGGREVYTLATEVCCNDKKGCPDEVIFSDLAYCGSDKYGGRFSLCYSCPEAHGPPLGWYWREMVFDSIGTCVPNGPVDQCEFPLILDEAGCINGDDFAVRPGPPGDHADCYDTAEQTCYVGPDWDKVNSGSPPSCPYVHQQQVTVTSQPAPVVDTARWNNTVFASTQCSYTP
jgi:hypothetical protein